MVLRCWGLRLWPCLPGAGWSRPARWGPSSGWWSPVWAPPSVPRPRAGTRSPRGPASCCWSCSRSCTWGGRSCRSTQRRLTAQTELEDEQLAAERQRNNGEVAVMEVERLHHDLRSLSDLTTNKWCYTKNVTYDKTGSAGILKNPKTLLRFYKNPRKT